MGKYAKTVVATLGSGITAALALVAPHTGLWNVLTVASALLTALGVYAWPNAGPTPPAGVSGQYVGGK